MNSEKNLNEDVAGLSALTDLLCNIKIGDKLTIRNTSDNCVDKAGDYECYVSQVDAHSFELDGRLWFYKDSGSSYVGAYQILRSA